MAFLLYLNAIYILCVLYQTYVVAFLLWIYKPIWWIKSCWLSLMFEFIFAFLAYHTALSYYIDSLLARKMAIV